MTKEELLASFEYSVLQHCNMHEKTRHLYKEFLKQNRIRHTKIKPRTPQSNRIVERLNHTSLEEFYQITFLKKVYSSLAELQDNLDKFIYYYNFKRTNQGYRLKDKILYQ